MGKKVVKTIISGGGGVNKNEVSIVIRSLTIVLYFFFLHSCDLSPCGPCCRIDLSSDIFDESGIYLDIHDSEITIELEQQVKHIQNCLEVRGI